MKFPSFDSLYNASFILMPLVTSSLGVKIKSSSVDGVYLLMPLFALKIWTWVREVDRISLEHSVQSLDVSVSLYGVEQEQNLSSLVALLSG
jgi:hypothetical protein